MIERNFSTEDDAIVWIIDNQMGRRNIESAAKIRLALKKEGIRTKEARSRQACGQGGVLLPQELAEASSEFGEVRDLIGKECGVSGFTVDKFKYIEKNAPNLADDLCSGKETQTDY